MKSLRLAPGLSLPADVVTQTLLVVGKRGSGKSNTAARLVEQLYAVKIPFVVLDPVDTWWGLKAGRDGGPGLEGIYVFGGKHADLPLEAGERSGALIAEVLCEHQLSMVLSVKHLSGRERSAFMVAFAQTLFQKWTGGPLHVVLEEAHELAPQNTQNAKEGEQQMLGAFKRLWKLGRASGIGGTAVTQRPASLSKDITTQSEILVAHRTIGPQDVEAIGQWIKYHGERSDILGELPSLPTGDAYVWGPEFPSDKPIGLRRVSVLLRETYDSASTPKVGEQRVEPKELAPADLDRLRAKMTATIERAKAEDPKELRKEIARLKGELAKAGKAAPPPDPAMIQQHVDAGVSAAMREEWKRAGRVRAALQLIVRHVDQQLASVVDRLNAARDEVINSIANVRRDAVEAIAVLSKETPAPVPPPVRRAPRVAAPVRSTQTAGASARRPLLAKVESTFGTENGNLPKGERVTLVAIAQHEDGVTREQLTTLTGYKKSTRNLYLQQLARRGYIDTRGDIILATDPGRAALGDGFEPLPTGDALRDYWLGRLPEGERRILHALADVYPDGMDRDALSAHTGYKKSTRNLYIQQLQRRKLVESQGADVRASDMLFSEALR